MMGLFVTLFLGAMVKTAVPITKGNGVVCWRIVTVCACAVLITPVLFNPANAAGATRGFEANPGEIVLLRDVPKGPAVRPGYPGEALLLDVGPVQQSGNKYSDLVEISDADAAVIHTGSTTRLTRPDSTLPASNLHRQTLPGGSALRSGMAGSAVMRNVSNIHRVTDEIDKQINAVVQPLGVFNVAK